MKNEMKIAALLGPQYIPLFRRQQKKRISDKFNHIDVKNLITKCEHRFWDYELAGDVIKEKYESLYVMIFNITLEFRQQGFIIDTLIMDKYIANLFVSCSHLGNSYDNNNSDIVRLFKIHDRWTLYEDKLLDDFILVTQRDLRIGIAIKHNLTF